jgi:hypothetical protein
VHYYPTLDHSGPEFSALPLVRESVGPGRVCPHDRRNIPDRAVRSFLVVVSTPVVQLVANVFERQERGCIDAFAAQLAVECLDERIVDRLPSSPCLITKAICASVNFDAFMPRFLAPPRNMRPKTLAEIDPVFRWQSIGSLRCLLRSIQSVSIRRLISGQLYQKMRGSDPSTKFLGP